MARVDDQVVLDTPMDTVRLRIGLTCNAIRPQRFPCPRDGAVAGHADPWNIQTAEGLSQPFLTSSAVKEHLVDDDAGPAGSECCNPDAPGRLEAPPPRSDRDLSGLADVQERSVVDPLVGNGSGQVIDAEKQPRRSQHRLKAPGDRRLA